MCVSPVQRIHYTLWDVLNLKETLNDNKGYWGHRCSLRSTNTPKHEALEDMKEKKRDTHTVTGHFWGHYIAFHWFLRNLMYTSLTETKQTAFTPLAQHLFSIGKAVANSLVWICLQKKAYRYTQRPTHTDPHTHRAGVGSVLGSAASVQLPNIERPLFGDPWVQCRFSYDHHGPFMFWQKQTYRTHKTRIHLDSHSQRSNTSIHTHSPHIYMCACVWPNTSAHFTHTHKRTHTVTLTTSLRSLSSCYLQTWKLISSLTHHTPVHIHRLFFFFVFLFFSFSFFHDCNHLPLHLSEDTIHRVHSVCNRGSLLKLKHKNDTLTPRGDLCTAS